MGARRERKEECCSKQVGVMNEGVSRGTRGTACGAARRRGFCSASRRNTMEEPVGGLSGMNEEGLWEEEDTTKI